MTVRVNKDAFNIREKLSELDYGHVPYDKMPAGSIIQFKTTSNSTIISHNSSTYVDIISLDFSPKSYNSTKLVTLSCPVRVFGSANTRQRIYFKLLRTLNGGETNIVTLNEYLHFRNANFASGSVEVCIPVIAETTDDVTGTSTLNYKWQFMSGDASAFDTAHIPYRISVYEIVK